ncbi:hypothetical protein Daesc_000014 [Daldinia eschscholtzii]|uniref:Uncharacterized protein n=1 Tax=Daldinia eschscholtzii TaxID=292717 RepID=A0AAX6MYI1_9PEZI
MIRSHSDNDGLRRHVSIGMLPRLTRAGTFEIETHLLMKHMQYRVRKLGKSCTKLARVISKILKYLAFAPYLPSICFFILVDKVITSMGSDSPDEYTDGSLDDITYFPVPKHHNDDNFSVIIETREVEG